MAAEVEIRPLAYNVVLASQTGQKLVKPAGSTGGVAGAGSINDILETLLIIPGTTSPGAVTIIDGGTSIIVFPGGSASVFDLKPFTVYIGARSLASAWSVTTGANVSVIASGRFS